MIVIGSVALDVYPLTRPYLPLVTCKDYLGRIRFDERSRSRAVYHVEYNLLERVVRTGLAKLLVSLKYRAIETHAFAERVRSDRHATLHAADNFDSPGFGNPVSWGRTRNSECNLVGDIHVVTGRKASCRIRLASVQQKVIPFINIVAFRSCVFSQILTNLVRIIISSRRRGIAYNANFTVQRYEYYAKYANN